MSMISHSSLLVSQISKCPSCSSAELGKIKIVLRLEIFVFNFTMYSKLFSFRDKYQRCPFWFMTHNIFHFILYLTKKTESRQRHLENQFITIFWKMFSIARGRRDHIKQRQRSETVISV